MSLNRQGMFAFVSLIAIVLLAVYVNYSLTIGHGPSVYMEARKDYQEGSCYRAIDKLVSLRNAYPNCKDAVQAAVLEQLSWAQILIDKATPESTQRAQQILASIERRAMQTEFSTEFRALRERMESH